MENASKALIIAGGIIISILVISIGVYLFASYGETGSSYEKTMQITEIQKLNSNFTKFEGRKDITIQEIVTVVNFAKQYKEQTEIDIKVYLSENELKDDDIITLIKNNSSITERGITKVKYFNCGLNPRIKDIEYDENGIVKLIRFN